MSYFEDGDEREIPLYRGLTSPSCRSMMPEVKGKEETDERPHHSRSSQATQYRG